MSYCSNCGAEITEGAAFCPNCGAGQVRPMNVQEQPVPTPEPEVVVPAEPVYQQPVYQQPTYQQPAYQQPIYQPPVLTGAAKILGIISMVCGLVSLVSCYAGIAPAIAAIILSNLAHKKAPGAYNKKADVGKTTGIIGIFVSALCIVGYLIYCFVLGFSMGSSYYY